MKAAPFGYHRPTTVDEAVGLLEAYEGTARVVAGGQSLVPMMNMRLIRPDALIDVAPIAELAELRVDGEITVVGAMVRYSTLERSPLVAERLPIVAQAVRHIGDRQVRNRGTLGGSLVQADPTGEMPLCCLVLGASLRVVGPAGEREVAVEDLYEGSYATTLQPTDVVTSVRFPRSPARHGFAEACRRHNDFAVISVAAVGERADDGTWSGIRIGLGGMHDTPVLAEAAAAAANGTPLADVDVDAAADAVAAAIDPPSDIRASAEYRRHLAPIYVRRVLHELRDGRAPAAEGGAG